MPISSERRLIQDAVSTPVKGIPLYYYYHTMAKALSAYGAERLELAGGRTTWWRQSLVSKLVFLQRIDPKTGFGCWQNDNNRWWESDANLTTAYAMLALEMACSGLEPASTIVKPEVLSRGEIRGDSGLSKRSVSKEDDEPRTKPSAK